MQIILSGKNQNVKESITVAQLIEQEQLETPKHEQVAVNDDFVEAEAFEKPVLQEVDVVEFLNFMGGGCR